MQGVLKLKFDWRPNCLAKHSILILLLEARHRGSCKFVNPFLSFLFFVWKTQEPYHFHQHTLPCAQVSHGKDQETAQNPLFLPYVP